jgi:hypothetical protein
MTVEKMEVVRYRLMCDECGAAGPEGAGKNEAESMASREGWQRWARWNGQMWISRDLCPECVADATERPEWEPIPLQHTG